MTNLQVRLIFFTCAINPPPRHVIPVPRPRASPARPSDCSRPSAATTMPRMPDPRIEKLADVLVNYSVGVQKGQLVRITSTPVALELVNEVFRRVLAAGPSVHQDQCRADA